MEREFQPQPDLRLTTQELDQILGYEAGGVDLSAKLHERRATVQEFTPLTGDEEWIGDGWNNWQVREHLNNLPLEQRDLYPKHVLRFSHVQPVPAELPPGYAFIGGAARNVLLAELGQAVEPPRDLDLVAITDWSPEKSQANRLAAQYMPGDYAHGHGVKFESLMQYFTLRDFTINEVLVTKDAVYATPQALRDLAEKVIQPTATTARSWESYAMREWGVEPKLAMKALRLHLQFEELYGHGRIEGIEEWQWRFEAVPLFYIALELNKAFEQGDAMAERFYQRLLTLGLVDLDHEDIASGMSARELAVDLRWKMHEDGRDPFTFTREELNGRVLPKELLAQIEDDPELAKYYRYAQLAASWSPPGEY
ncbi:MAG: hypothetical protein ACOYBJ_03270 [Patescibacteria group bacterium]